MRTADALVSEATGKSSGWIDRTGAQLTPTPAAGFCRRHTVTDGVIQMVIRQAEDAGRRLPFTEWIPWVSLAARIALQDRANPQLHTILDYLETLGAGCTGGV